MTAYFINRIYCNVPLPSSAALNAFFAFFFSFLVLRLNPGLVHVEHTLHIPSILPNIFCVIAPNLALMYKFLLLVTVSKDFLSLSHELTCFLSPLQPGSNTKMCYCWAAVAHAWNPSYSETRRSMAQSQPWTNSSLDPMLKKPITNNQLVEWLKR
jgi:hypothetical protein